MKDYLITFQVAVSGIFGIRKVNGSEIVNAKSKKEAVKKILLEASVNNASCEIIKIEEL